MAKEEEERKIQAAQAASSLPSGIVLPPKPTKNIQRAQRTADKIIKTPMFFMSTAKFMNYDDESEEEDEEAQEAKKRLTKKELRELKARNRKSRGVRIAEDGYVMFYTEFRAQVCHGMTQLLSDERGGNNWRTVWRDIVGPILMLVCVILVWITAFNLYMTQMNDGPTPRPRLTLSFAMDKHEAEATPMVVAVGLQAALMIGCFAYAGRELSLSVTAYICFLAVSGLTGMFVMLYTLNCSFYTLGTPFIEVITSRTLFNCYAWVVSFMIRPLETVGGRFPKRNNDTAASSSESDYDDDEDEEEEEEEVKVDTKKTSALTIPSMTGVMPEEEDDSDKQSDDSEEEEEEEEEEGEEEEEDEEEETRDCEEAEESTKDDETESV
jgi:hypothetical protein